MAHDRGFSSPRVASSLCILLVLACFGHAQSGEDAEEKLREADKGAYYEDRIVTPEQVAKAMRPNWSGPFLVLGWPIGKLNNGMEKGLISFEKNKIREKIYDFQMKLSALGFRPLFGGLGEGSGMGLGTVYQVPPAVPPQLPTSALQLLGRMSLLSGYQEFAANFLSSPFRTSNLILLTNYQWRPNEPYYGYGQDSRQEDASSFALRQTSFAVRWEQKPYPRLSFGTEYTVAFLKAKGTTRGTRPSIEEVFGAVPGVNERTQLQSIGAFVGGDGIRGEYGLGGRFQVGASWQESFGDADIRYARIEGRIEGRLPIAKSRSVLIGQAATELTREDHGSDPLPFYLYPRIGGSSTLRGFQLDRFYGRNMIFATLEYRVAMHPNMEFTIFYDEGQIFQHTQDLSFLDWHRNYGVGLRFRNRTGTQFRIEFATSAERFTIHISFGDRLPRPLGGPVRYPNYRP